jgi:hypothetical protein
MMPYKTAGECAQEYENRLIERHVAPLRARLAEATALLERTKSTMLSGKWLVDYEAFLSATPSPPAEPAPSLVEQAIGELEAWLANPPARQSEYRVKQALHILRAAREAGGR